LRQETQHEVWNPFCERVDNLSASERAEMEISRAWACYAGEEAAIPNISIIRPTSATLSEGGRSSVY
jgi:hypothetical protein